MLLKWTYQSFNDLSPSALYAIMGLRSEVFVVEQNCVYQDADQKDQPAFHLCGWDEEKLAAYCRILPPGIAFNEPSIGRVVTSPAYRKTGSGRQLMQLAIEKTLQQFGQPLITIGAQLYLEKFYTSLGFVPISSTYLEDNISHIHMQLKATI